MIYKDTRETKVENGKGWLGVNMAWTDQKGNVLLKEETEFIFSGDEIYQRIERRTKLTAVVDQVIFNIARKA